VKELFVRHRFTRRRQEVLEQANVILDEYQVLGHKLTLRQLFYQFVARDLLPNSPETYRLVCGTVNDGRDAGEIDWSMIEDRSRELQHVGFDANPASAIKYALNTYKEDPWLDQPYAPIVAIEKDALLGVIEPVCDEYRVKRLSLRGNCSDTLIYELAKHFVDQEAEGKTPVLLLLTDHDPTGVISMPADIAGRLKRYAEQEIEVRRLGLTKDQVRRYRLPNNPAKDKDPRYPAYHQQFGDKSWELDALAPDVLVDLVGDELNSLIDQDAWTVALALERNNKTKLEAAARKLELDLGRTK
jgi:hypothetical protein